LIYNFLGVEMSNTIKRKQKQARKAPIIGCY
jgi:hypothetical protein